MTDNELIEFAARELEEPYIPPPPQDIHRLCIDAIDFVKGFLSETKHFQWALENDGIGFFLTDDSRGNNISDPSRALKRGRYVDAADLLSFRCNPAYTRCVGIRLRKGETY